MRKMMLVLIVVAGLLAPVSAANADGGGGATSRRSSTTTLSKSYQVTKTLKVKGAPACLKVAMSGKMRITRWRGWRASAMGGVDTIELTNPRIVNPRLTLKTRRCSGKRKRVKVKAWLKQHLLATNLSCKNSASISLSFPWGISLSPTSNCPKRRKATLATSNGGGSRFSQYEESTTGWPKSKASRWVVWDKKITTCVKLNAQITVRRKGKTYGTGDRAVGKVCLSA